MSFGPVICTCDQREHACSPPCKAHPERGGGLGNPGRPRATEDAVDGVIAELWPAREQLRRPGDRQ